MWWRRTAQRVVLGITGGTGAGKTSALRAIEELGGQVIDCDAAYHEMLAENEELRNAINEKFPGVFQSDGSLNRRKLGEEVFARKDRMEQLNEIVFRFLVPEIERRVEALPDGLYAIDAVNLLESGLDHLCDQTIAVTAPLELRVRPSWPGTELRNSMPACGSPRRKPTNTIGANATVN